MTSGRLLVVEDDEALAELIASDLGERGYRVDVAGGHAEALRALDGFAPDLVLTDLRLPDGSGFDVLSAAIGHSARPAVVLITAFGTVPQAVEALKAGADDFLTKPLDLEHLAVKVQRAVRDRRTRGMLENLRGSLIGSSGAAFHGMVGGGAVMEQLFGAVRRVAAVDEPVLVLGESGTGKEGIARAIHAESARGQGPFVAVNCASIPEALLEAEFFGHTADAFTGARGARRGLFAEADGGSLFLDEIGEMSPGLQAKLLRALEERRVRPLGASAEIDVDVRVIAATNRKLEDEVGQGRWRADLYYRLEALTVVVPPLRERGDEHKNALIAHFLNRLAAARGLPELRLGADAMEALERYAFPGNVRELGNALARAATFGSDGLIGAADLPGRMRPELAQPAGDGDPLGITRQPPPTLSEIEQRYIRWIVERTGNNKKRAAEILDVGRRTIYRKLD